MQPVAQPIDRPAGPIRLGEWTLDPDRNLLTSSDTELRLEPKAVDALIVLIEGDGKVVSKNELIDRVWEGRIISEGTLTNTIAELRRALGDDARNPSYIETIPKRGYRIVCPVGRGGAGDLSDPAPTRAPAVLGWVIVGAVTAAAVIAAVLIWTRPAALAADHVLATPFANRTGEPGLDAFSTLARDRILAELAGSGIARPVPADSPLVGSISDICRSAAAEGAGLAINGALYLHDGEVEIQAQLVDVVEGELLYAVPPVIGPRDEVTASIEEAVQRVLGALAIHLTSHAHATLHSRPPVFEAYREFIAGSEIFTDDLPVALGHLERAVELDPEFTSAQFRLAMGYKHAGRAPEGRTILDRLHARRGELTEFERLWLDSFFANFEGRWADGLSTLNMLADQSSSDWTVLYLIGAMELSLNRPGDAVETIEALHNRQLPGFVTRHPLYAHSFEMLARAYHQLGDHAAELAAVRAGRELFATHAGLMISEARCRGAVGDGEGLDRLVETAGVAPGRNPSAAVLVAAAASADAHGHPALATDLASRAVDAIERNPPGLDGPRLLLLGRALAQLGDLDRSQSALEEAIAALAGRPGGISITARGWLGVIAARRGDVATAEAADLELSTMDDPYLYGSPIYYRSAIAAWRGQRETAIELIRAARAAGWARFYRLHDDERFLFEPLEGMGHYRAMLEPEG